MPPPASDLAGGIAALLGQPGTPIAVSPPERAFGGNARQAWTCLASWEDGSGRHDEELILLVRAAGSQVRTDPAGEFAVLDGLAEAGVRRLGSGGTTRRARCSAAPRCCWSDCRGAPTLWSTCGPTRRSGGHERSIWL